MSFILTKAVFPEENALNANTFYHFAMAYDICKNLAPSCATPACFPYLESRVAASPVLCDAEPCVQHALLLAIAFLLVPVLWVVLSIFPVLQPCAWKT